MAFGQFRMKKAKIKNNVEELRHNMINKNSWSIFVGDRAYKTNFFHRFLTTSSNNRYYKATFKTNIIVIKMLIYGLISILIFNWICGLYATSFKETAFLVISFITVILMIK